MLTVEVSPLPEVEELQKLVADGQEKGFLTYDEIVSGLEEVELTKEQVEDFYTHLSEHNIELVEGEQHKTPPHEQPVPEDDKPAAATPKMPSGSCITRPTSRSTARACRVPKVMIWATRSRPYLFCT